MKKINWSYISINKFYHKLNVPFGYFQVYPWKYINLVQERVLSSSPDMLNECKINVTWNLYDSSKLKISDTTNTFPILGARTHEFMLKSKTMKSVNLTPI